MDENIKESISLFEIICFFIPLYNFLNYFLFIHLYVDKKKINFWI